MTKLLLKLGLGLASIIVLIFLGQLIFDSVYRFPQKITYGVSFSPKYARYLGLDWKQTYINSLDLGIKNFRIPTYWSEIEKKLEEFSFEDIDFMLSEAQKKQAKIILVVGLRQPRWPECYVPSWAKNLSKQEKNQKILQFIEKTVDRYKDDPSVWAWQVENEPLLPFFGEGCTSPDQNFLKTEVEQVRRLSSKSIIVTDSGELGFWVKPMSLSDIFGTTVYRKAYDPVLGYKVYPILPYLYNIKSSVARIFAPSNKKTIIAELQAEPWLSQKDLSEGSPAKQAQIFSMNDFKNYIDYAKKTGFDEAYLWGVEWWYFMANHGHPEYLEYAKTLFD